MLFLSFIVLLVIAYLIWRVTDQLPDLIFRLSEIQRDIAEIRRRMADEENPSVSGPATSADESPADQSSADSSSPS